MSSTPGGSRNRPGRRGLPGGPAPPAEEVATALTQQPGAAAGSPAPAPPSSSSVTPQGRGLSGRGGASGRLSSAVAPAPPVAQVGSPAAAALAGDAGARLAPTTIGALKDAFGSYAREGQEYLRVASIRRGLSSPTMAGSRRNLREVFGRYASPTRTSTAVEALRAAFNSPEFEHQRRTLRAAFADLMPVAASGDEAVRPTSDDRAFSALLSASVEAQQALR
jgi:hypothetical protein